MSRVNLSQEHLTYKEYINTDIDWFSGIPKGWKVKKLKFIAEIVLGKMLQNDSKVDNDQLKPYLRAQNILWEKVDISNLKEMWVSAYERKKFLLQKDDLLVSEGGEVGRTSIWNDELPECYIQNSVNRVRVFSDHISRFFLYQFEAFGKSNVFSENVNRVSIAHLTREKLKEFYFVVPDKENQMKISNYLDKKTETIDCIIDTKKKQIELLQEKRSALITRAVTRGIDRNVKMKDSGVEWIGEIPEGWKFSSVRHVCKVLTGGTPSRDNMAFWENGTINWLYSGDINKRHIYEVDQKITELGMKNSNATLLPAKCVLIALNGQGKTKGMVATLEVRSTCNQSLAAIIPNSPLDYRFIYFYLFSKYKEIRALVGDARDGLNLDHIKEIILPIPSIEEQNEIIKYLEKHIEKIESAIKKIEQSINLFTEYKISLISHAVTGKIKI